MKKLKNDLYVLVRNSLQGSTPQEQLADVEHRIFMNDMVDNWTREDYEFNDVLYKIKEELENQINGNKEWSNSVGTITNY